MCSCSTVITKMMLLMFKLLSVSLLSPRVFSLFLILLANTFFTSFFLDSTLLVWETKTIVIVKAISWEEKSYPKPVQSKANFWKLIISSSFALEVLSSWTLTWNNSTSSFLVFSAKKLFSISVFQWSDRLHQTSWIFLLVQAPLHWVSW